jgi:multisubunit Na+/H+ antiporter MnhC subunit
MQNEIFHKLKTTGTIILSPTTVLLVFVWTFLEKVLPIKSKQELEAIYLVQLILTAIIILVALSAFAVFLLIKTIKINKKTSDLEKGNLDLTQKAFVAQTTILSLMETNNKYQAQIAKQECKLSLFSKYTFDSIKGCLISKADSKPYCTACILEFKEVPLDTKRPPAKCSECGTQYPIQARFIDDPYRNI